MKRSRGILVAAAWSVVLTAGLSPRAAHAHESQVVGPKGEYVVVVGWKQEPAFSGVMNAAAVIITRASDGRAINTKAGDVVDLDAEIQFRSGAPKDAHDSKVLESLALGKAKLEAYKENQYIAWVQPETPGVYAFHFKGSIEDKSDPKAGRVTIDVTIVCGENKEGHHDHFSCVHAPATFPSKAAAAKAAEPSHPDDHPHEHEHPHSHGHRN
jgi:hypothetical protein